MILASSVHTITNDALLALGVLGVTLLTCDLVDHWGNYHRDEWETPFLIILSNIALSTFSLLRGRSIGFHYFPHATFYNGVARVVTTCGVGVGAPVAFCIIAMRLFPGKNGNSSSI